MKTVLLRDLVLSYHINKRKGGFVHWRIILKGCYQKSTNAEVLIETNTSLVSRSGEEERQESLWQRHFSLFTKLLQLFDLHSNSTMEIANYIPDSSIEMEMTPNGMCARNRNRYIFIQNRRFYFKFRFLHFQQTLCEVEISLSMLKESPPPPLTNEWWYDH